MILTTHALVGSALGKNIDSLWMLIPISLLLHFAMDNFRHGEYAESFDSKTSFRNTWWKVALDISIALSIISSLVYFENPSFSQLRNILIGSFFSAFPDLLTVIHWKFKLKVLSPIYRFHSWCHQYPAGSKERNWTLRNVVNDLAFSIAAIIIFLAF